MTFRAFRIAASTFALASGLVAVAALLLVLSVLTTPVQAGAPARPRSAPHLQNGSPLTRYVAITGTDAYTCATPISACRTVQYAVDVADAGDVIKIASGVYTGINHHGGLAQVVYVSKTLTIQGGYTAADWARAHPLTQPTTLDAGGQGRVLYATGDISLTVEGVYVTSGNAARLGGPVEGDYGGGLYVNVSTTTLRSNTLISNSANGRGGGLYLSYGSATLRGNTLISNSAYYGGGGIHAHYTDATLEDNHFIANYGEYGGGLALVGGSATVSNSTFISNTGYEGGAIYLGDDIVAMLIANTINNNSTDGGGGGLAISRSKTTLVGNTIASNTTSVEGGGLISWGRALTLTGNTFAANSAGHWGGGMCGEATVLTGNTFVANFAGAYGGGLCLWYTATLVANIFTANSTGGEGGGLYGGSDRDGLLVGNTFTANVAVTGGGLYLEGAATLINNLIADNQASAVGSGLLIAYSPLPSRLLHNTIAHNTGGDGSGVYVASSRTSDIGTAWLTNTILVGNAVGITVTAGNTATLEATLWDNATDWGGPGAIFTGTHNYWGDPAFVNPGAGDYHIRPTSAAIDKGLDAGVNEDMDGTARPIGYGYDIGADESEISLAGAKWATPETVRPGMALTYTISITNAGLVTLTPTITDVLPSHVTPTGVLTWTPAAIVPGGVWTKAVVVTVEMGYTGPLTNVVEVTTAEGATGAYTATSQVRGTPSLAVTTRAAPSPVAAGARLTYTIRVTNTGDVHLHATVTDTLPAHVAPSGVLTWTPAIPAPGGVWVKAVVVTAEMDYAGPLTNVVEVTTAEGATGAYTATSQVRGTPSLAVTTRADPDPVAAGARLTYTIRITNTGDVHLHATVTDTLPARVAPSGVLTWTPAIPAPGGVWTKTIAVTVEMGYSGPLTNVVEAKTQEGATGRVEASTTAICCRIYLPVVLRQYSHA